MIQNLNRIEIVKEIKDAKTKGDKYTNYRKFFDLSERIIAGRKCYCGKPSLYISYCVHGMGCCVLCPDCFKKEVKSERNEDRTK